MPRFHTHLTQLQYLALNKASVQLDMTMAELLRHGVDIVCAHVLGQREAVKDRLDLLSRTLQVKALPPLEDAVTAPTNPV